MKSLIIVTTAIALFQVHQVNCFYSIFQSNPTSPQAETQPEPAQTGEFGAPGHHQQQFHNHHHGGHHAGLANFGMGIIAQAQKLKQQLGQMGTMGFGGNMGFNFGQHNQHQHFPGKPPVFPVYTYHIVDGRKAFYSDCGSATRHCEWVQKTTNKMGHHHHHHHHHHHPHHEQMQVQAPADPSAKPEMEYTCYSIKHVCVGNTENCISNRTCDVAMKISEMTFEINGKAQAPFASSVSYLNNCNMEGQSVTDGSRMPQMLFAIGFTTHDETGKTIECRRPKASDFKLVFLWKNSTVDESNKSNGHCTAKPAHRQAVHFHDVEMMNSVNWWPSVCNAMEKKEGEFSLKSFLANHAPVSKYTSSFSPPFEFADNYQPQYSSNGMVISGVLAN